MFEKIKNDIENSAPDWPRQHLANNFKQACDYAESKMRENGLGSHFKINSDLDYCLNLREFIPFRIYSDKTKSNRRTIEKLMRWDETFDGYISLYAIGNYESHMYFLSKELFVPFTLRYKDQYSFVIFGQNCGIDFIFERCVEFIDKKQSCQDFDLSARWSG